MNHFLRFVTCTCAILCSFFCGLGISQSTNEVQSSAKSTSGIPELIVWNPRYLFEEFAIAAASDIFTETELNEFAIWEYSPERLPIYLLISEKNDFVVLTESDKPQDEPSYKANKLDFPPEAGLTKSASLSYTYYDMFEKDIDQDGKNEYVISAEVIGMVEAEDGMRPVHFLKSVVFTRHDYNIRFSNKLSTKYNKDTGTLQLYINESRQAILSKKYYRLGDMEDDWLKRSLLQSLVTDMGISSSNSNSENAYGKVELQPDGAHAVYTSFVGFKYFVATSPNDFSELSRIDEDFYPLMIDSYQMTDIYSISSATVDNGEVTMILVPLPESESETTNQTIVFSLSKAYWTLSSDEIDWLPKHIRKHLKRIEDD